VVTQPWTERLSSASCTWIWSSSDETAEANSSGWDWSDDEEAREVLEGELLLGAAERRERRDREVLRDWASSATLVVFTFWPEIIYETDWDERMLLRLLILFILSRVR
jgi:hypothetical protein